MEAVFTIKNLKFLDIISYPDIQIESLKTTFICGDSGCGKSTLLKLLNATVSGTGEILYYSKNIDEIDTITLRRDVLLCSQSVFLFDVTIKENFVEFYRYRESSCPSDEKILEFLQLCCIDCPLDTNCTLMSGGERHRIYIAICLSFMPSVLMLDEPTSALDDYNSNNLLQKVKTFCNDNKLTLLVVCHNKSLVDNFADAIINIGRSEL